MAGNPSGPAPDGAKADLQITQIRSLIGSQTKQRATLRGLGLRRIRHTVVQPDRPEIRGMIAKVSHLVEVKEADGTVVRPPRKRASETRMESGKISPVEQHTAGLGAADVTERPPAAPDSPASPTATEPEDQPSTGPSGETSTSSAPGTPAEDVTPDADDTASDDTEQDQTS